MPSRCDRRLRLRPVPALPAVFLTLLAAAGCGPDEQTPDMGIGCTGAYLGDPNLPMQLELFYLGVDLLPHDLPACAPLDIVVPPQGGYVVFVGVHATNLDPCNASMSGALRDPRDNSILGLEQRSTIFTPLANRPGWGATSPGGDTENGFRYVSNIPVCPNMSSDENPRDVAQELGLIDILIIDTAGKRGEIVQRVFPRCAQPGAAARSFCNCNCKSLYSVGKCTGPGGAPVDNFPEPPDAGACYPPDLARGPDLAGSVDLAGPDGHDDQDGSQRDGS